MGLQPTKVMNTFEETKAPVAYARGSECGVRAIPSRDREGVGAVGHRLTLS